MGDEGRDESGADARERERARRVEHQLALAQQITHLGSWEWDLATGVVTWSDELYRIYGLEPKSCEITFELFVSKLHPEDRARVTGEVQQAIQRGGRFAYPERITRPDGSVRHLATVGEVAVDGNGKTLGLIGTCRDVTDELARDESIRLFAQVVECVQIGLSVWRVGDAADPGGATLVAYNPAAERATGAPFASSIGKTIVEVLGSAAGPALLGLIAKVRAGGGVEELAVHRFAESTAGSRAFSLKAFALPTDCVGLALEDVTAQTRARQLVVVEQKVLEMVASGRKLEEVLEALVLFIEEEAPPTLASILLLDADGKHIRRGAAPHLPEDFSRAIDGAPIGPAVGSCGSAAFLRRAVFVEDIDTDPLWADYRELAQRFGLRSCWSTPVFASDGRVLGTFALYDRQPRRPTPEDLELISRATHVAGLAIQQRQLDEQLRALSAHTESVREEERTGIAREIHDELGQALTAVKMDVAWIARRLADDGEVPRQAVKEKLASMSQMTDELIGHVRRISSELRPGVLDDLGLSAAIEWQAQEFEERTGTTCDVTSQVGDARLDRNLSTTVFRIFQEALTNVARHADAKNVEVRLELRDGSLLLVVRDDGRGISDAAVNMPSSLGLLGIRERARRLGGVVSIARVEGSAGASGTSVELCLPVGATS